MRVLGVDPGIANLGLAVVEGGGRKARLLFSEVVTTASREPAEARVGRLFTRTRQVLDAYRPEAVALEAQYFYRQNERAFQVGWGVGAVLAAASLAGRPVFAYGPMQIKKALVGAGRAEKSQVAFMLRALLDGPLPSSNHATDAIAVALTHLAQPPQTRDEFRL